jgi:bifunctional non-homologous end joining protein LigD
MVFDFLAFDGQDLRRLPLYERRMLLEGLLRGAPDELWFSGDFEDGEALFRHACAIGLEGIISKRRDSPIGPAGSMGGEDHMPKLRAAARGTLAVSLA